MSYDTVWFTNKATTQSGIQARERFSLSDPGHVMREPSHNGLGSATLQGPWTHFMPVGSRAMAHWQLTTLMGTGWVQSVGGHGSPNMGVDSTGTASSYQLADAVYLSNTMDNLALMSPLVHPLAEFHGQAVEFPYTTGTD